MTQNSITAQSTMMEVLEQYPGARRALFRRYHIGGCSSCGFQPEETLGQVCGRNNVPSVDEVIEHIRTSHEQDEKLWLSPMELKALLQQDAAGVRLLDIRSREEHEAVRVDNSTLLSQLVMQEILSRWSREQLVVIIDHNGQQGLDGAAYFAGHGFTNVRCLRGGIDAWAQEIDPTMRRYRVS